jgi:hypothetical protein
MNPTTQASSEKQPLKIERAADGSGFGRASSNIVVQIAGNAWLFARVFFKIAASCLLHPFTPTEISINR